MVGRASRASAARRERKANLPSLSSSPDNRETKESRVRTASRTARKGRRAGPARWVQRACSATKEQRATFAGACQVKEVAGVNQASRAGRANLVLAAVTDFPASRDLKEAEATRVTPDGTSFRDGLATLALMAGRESEDCPGDRATRDSRGGMDFLDLRGARAPRVQWEFRDKRVAKEKLVGPWWELRV